MVESIGSDVQIIYSYSCMGILKVYVPLKKMNAWVLGQLCHVPELEMGQECLNENIVCFWLYTFLEENVGRFKLENGNYQ